MTSTLFGELGPRIKRFEGELIPLHVGDTWLLPVAGARMQDLANAQHPRLHRYADPAGWAPLWDALVESLRARPAFGWVEKGSVLISAGCTGALAATVGALLEPGDEVLLCSPYWPLIPGIVRSRGAVPVDLPCYDRAHDPQALREALERATTPRTVALYTGTPNNPSGVVLDERALQLIAAHARRHDLWILSDEVYEHYSYAGPHRFIAGMAPERTISTFSFSKAYGQAGNRCGYLVGPEATVRQVRRFATHLVYNAPVPGQVAALAALQNGDAWLQEARGHYRQAGDRAADALGVPRPQGGTFLFLDVAPWLDERGLLGFLERCVDRGLLLAPGPSFGQRWTSHVRLCFTCEDPERTARGVAILAELMGRAAIE